MINTDQSVQTTATSGSWLDGIKSFFEKAKEVINKVISVINKVIDAVTKIFGVIKEKVATITGYIGKVADDVNAVKESAVNAYNDIKNGNYSKAADSSLKVLNASTNIITDAVGGVGGEVVNIVSGSAEIVASVAKSSET